jgi:hypothetical protein
MPLAFNSLSHGKIAFGFIHIESDMLLLEQYFLFGSEFCQHMASMAENDGKDASTSRWTVYVIEDRVKIGDLMGAIHGIRYTGFIGELYRICPFPREPEAFKQKPTGNLSQETVRGIISDYARHTRLAVDVQENFVEVSIGEYRFSPKTLHELIRYVWRGGYPGWQQGIRPDYVNAMKAKIEDQRQGLFETIQFD